VNSGLSNDAAERRDRYRTVARALERLTDGEVARLLAASDALGSGIGGVRWLVEVAGARVFVKQVPLSEPELTPQGFRSTANLFDLPMGCHYGIASPGFGVWREVAANEAATRMVAAGRANAFPMLYHWRIREEPLGSSDLDAIVEEVAGLWHGTPKVQARLTALANAPATVLLFFEFIPTTLLDWLDRQVGLGTDATDAAIETVEADLLEIAADLTSAGLLHFDAHFGNMLTDGSRIYLADFGLANSPQFQLADSERRFIAENATHDRCHMLTRLVDWTVAALIDGQDWEQRDLRIRMVRDGDQSGIAHLSPTAVSAIQRHAPVAAVINDFYRRLRFDDRQAEYPTDAIQRALRTVR